MKAIFLILFLAGTASAQTSIVTDFGITKAVGDGAYVLKAGDTMTGSLYINDNNTVARNLTVSGAPTSTGDARLIMDVSNTSTAYNASPMADIGFDLLYTNTGASSVLGAIGAGKENATTANTAGYVTLKTRPAGSVLTERVRVTSAGNVGIGNTNPASKLDISSGTITLAGTGAPSAGYALCLTATKQIGRCSNTPAADGACTCAVN